MQQVTTPVASSMQSWMLRVFSWMVAGLFMTGIIAYVLSQNPAVPKALAGNSVYFWGIFIAQLVVVFGLSFLINKISPLVATIGFFLYAGLNGVTMTLILHYFSLGTVFSAFFIAAGMFGLFAFYGYVTKRDLSRIGSIAIMFLIGVILATVVNAFFVKSGVVSLIISYAIVGLFCIITAFDIQMIKNMGNEAMDEGMAEKMAIYGALALYIDFIAIFRNLVFILGDD